ncbi:MAG: hypothetical protein WD271_10425 [Acidimicrobiia bacterium]
MARNWIVGGVVVLVLAAAGAAVALRAKEGGGNDAQSAPATNSTAPTAPASSTTAPPTTAPPTTAPAETTVAPTTSAPPAPGSPAGSPPGPCGVEVGAIRAAVDNGVTGARDGAEVAECRLAAVDPSWALVFLDPKSGAEFAESTVVLHGGGGAWTIVDMGTSQIGCGKVPQQVLVDLGLFCVGSGSTR